MAFLVLSSLRVRAPCRLSTSSPGPALSPVRSALLRCAPVLKAQALVGHGRVSATAPRKPFLGAARPLTDPEPSQQVLRPIFCVAAETYFPGMASGCWIGLKPETSGGWVSHRGLPRGGGVLSLTEGVGWVWSVLSLSPES